MDIQLLISKRKEKKISQSQLAKLCGFTRQAYNNYENGSRRLSVDKAQTIADVLEFDWTLLFPKRKNILAHTPPQSQQQSQAGSGE